MSTSKWISVHVFYASSADPMLVEAVAPLVATLRERGLIERYFFVKYWLEGPHVRLRLLPVNGAEAEVIGLTEQHIGAFLLRRPALFELNQTALLPVYKRLFLAEYGQRGWDETYGPDGQMPFRPTNSMHYIDYEPEYDRYGGPAGVEAAEWHFEQSSDVVLRLLSTTNVHVRTVMLGLSVQLCLAMCYALLDDDESAAEFFATYRRYWETSYAVQPGEGVAGFERAYSTMDRRLAERLTVVRAGVRDAEGAGLSPLQRGWVGHARELRERLGGLAADGRLLLRGSGSGPEATPVTDPAIAFPILLGSYLHMTNNRLGVTIRDEIYLAYVLERAVRDAAATAKNGAGLPGAVSEASRPRLTPALAEFERPLSVPRLRSDVRLGRPLRSNGRTVHYLKDPRTAEFFRVGVKEFFLIERLDGSQPLSAIGADYTDRFGKRLGDAQWGQLLGLLSSRDLLTSGEATEHDPADSPPASPPRAPRSWRRLAIPLVDPDAALGRLARRVGFLFHPAFVVPALVILAGVELVVVTHVARLWHDLRYGQGRAAYVPAAIAFSWFVLGLHEAAHGLACKRFGGSVPEIGLLWRLPLIAPYCRVDDVVVMPKRRYAAATSLAGVFTSLLVLLPVLPLWWLSTPGSGFRGLTASMLLFGSLGALINLVPFLQLDGYYVLNHALGMADLRADSYRLCRRLVAAAVPGRARRAAFLAELRRYSLVERWICLSYGICSALLVAGGTMILIGFAVAQLVGA